nr:FCD domain-containing protein [Pseudomaricurvus sp. HS19]
MVQDAAARLREVILQAEPDSNIGSLNEVAEQLGVGIVTVQQAARVLEHEGLLTVKRGPGGGYYGTRPDDAAMERAFATYMRINDISYRDAFELSVVLDCEIIRTVAGSYDARHKPLLDALLAQLEAITSAEDVIRFEQDFRETLLRICSRPLLELLARVAMQMYTAKDNPNQFVEQFGIDEWRLGRRRILQAVLQHDPELAYFEAQRFRNLTLNWMGENPR